jgi:putative peptidoglycan lipid II flippase
VTTADDDRVLASSAVMAAGTVVSRLSGFVRSTLLVAALGVSLHADIFTIANTIPNMLYILLAGGVFNAVLVPQLVRAMRNDPDGGEAYTNRVVTLAGIFLAIVTVLLVIAAPLVMSLMLHEQYSEPALVEQRQSAIDFARLCLPQVFFYGMFVLVGQILNSRRRFGPMMWAPIANNVIAVAVLVIYLMAFGPASTSEQVGPFTTQQELLLGLGSTAGIVAQFLILIPYLRAAGYRYRPRFDFRHAGLGHTLRLGIWTVLFVIVNQVAYVVVVRLASGGTAGGGDGTGITIYSNAFLIVMVPHAIVTVSLATAVLTRLSSQAAESDLGGLSRSLASTLRAALVVIVPFAALLPVIADDVSNVIWGHGAGADLYERYVPTLSLFGAGLLFFTVHYMVLRGFYALEQNRTVFWIQCAVATTNIVVAVVVVARTDAENTSPALVLAYTAAYVVGSLLSYTVLRARLGGLETPQLLHFLARLALAVAVSTAVALAVSAALHAVTDSPHWLLAAVIAGVVMTLDGVVFVLVAKAIRIREVTSVLETVTGRLLRSRHT